MRILSRVCADFYDKNRDLVFRFTRENLGDYYEVPDSIREDPLFQMLLDDGSIKLPPDDAKEKRALENDPMAGADASGREIKPKVESRTSAKAKVGSRNSGDGSSVPAEHGTGKTVPQSRDKAEAVTEEKPAEIK